MKSQYYFAYGSNLNMEQMASRCPLAEPTERAYLANFSLEFKTNVRGSGVATIRPDYGNYVEGALYKITPTCLSSLDMFEGHPLVYCRASVNVFTYSHMEMEAVTYIMTRRFARSVPSIEYLCRIQDGYLDFGIPFDTLVSAYESVLEMKEGSKQC